MTGSREPQLDWERQGWSMRGPEVPYERAGRPNRNQYGWALERWIGPAQQSAQLPGQFSAPQPALRIGDAERDEAIRELGDHFAAGRLEREEFDERSATAMRARVRGDLDTLFTDLPRAKVSAPVASRGLDPRMLPLFWLAPPLLLLAVGLGLLTAVVANAPWVLWMLMTVFVFTGLLRGRHRRPPHLR